MEDLLVLLIYAVILFGIAGGSALITYVWEVKERRRHLEQLRLERRKTLARRLSHGSEKGIAIVNGNFTEKAFDILDYRNQMW